MMMMIRVRGELKENKRKEEEGEDKGVLKRGNYGGWGG